MGKVKEIMNKIMGKKTQSLTGSEATPNKNQPYTGGTIMGKKGSLRYFMTSDVITVFLSNKAMTIISEQENFEKVRKLLLSEDYSTPEEVTKYFVTREQLEEDAKKISSEEVKVEVTSTAVLVNGIEATGIIVNRILHLKKENKPFTSLVEFLKNVAKNPLESARRELFDFLYANDLPITQDGCFLAYKKVRKDYMDCHSGEYDNHIGKTVVMPREKCDANRENTCSFGLHFASYDYMGSYTGERIVIVKINPQNVVAFPKDYGNQKGRCCEYAVIGELPELEGQVRLPENFVDTDKEPMLTKKPKKAKEQAETEKPEEVFKAKTGTEFLLKEANSFNKYDYQPGDGAVKNVFLLFSVPAGKDWRDVLRKVSKTNPELKKLFEKFVVKASTLKADTSPQNRVVIAQVGQDGSSNNFKNPELYAPAEELFIRKAKLTNK